MQFRADEAFEQVTEHQQRDESTKGMCRCALQRRREFNSGQRLYLEGVRTADGQTKLSKRYTAMQLIEVRTHLLREIYLGKF